VTPVPRAAQREGPPDRVGEQHLRLLVDAARDCAIFTLDGEGRVLTWNSGAQRFNGCEEQEILGEHFSCFYALDDRKAGRAGHELIAALCDPGGRLVGFGHVTRDITERLQATERFRLALEGAPTGMIMVDALGLIVLVNAQVEKLFGYPREDLVGESIELLVPVRYRQGHSGHRGAFLAVPEARPMGAGRELFGLRKDGTEVPIEIGLNPLKSAEGEFVLASIVDITERKHAEREKELLLDKLRASNAQLTTSLKEREVLLQEVHHRVKNNLQVISSLINMQLRRFKGGSSREALEECQTRVQAIALIHAQLYQSDDQARVALTAYVRSLAANVFDATSVSRSSVSPVLDIDDVVLAVDRAIPCGLILNELITNALKHAFPDGRRGTVRIEIKRIGGGKLRLRVADDGIGIAPGTEIGKTGSLGLHLVTTLSEQLNAELDVDGREGTAFQLTFAAEEP
jgi:PAS domain S-box-containing protein